MTNRIMPEVRNQSLLVFAVEHMTAHKRIVLLQFKAIRIVATVLETDVHMTAFRATELDECAVAFLCHAIVPFPQVKHATKCGVLIGCL